jgi:hypothetical protein
MVAPFNRILVTIVAGKLFEEIAAVLAPGAPAT